MFSEYVTMNFVCSGIDAGGTRAKIFPHGKTAIVRELVGARRKVWACRSIDSNQIERQLRDTLAQQSTFLPRARLCARSRNWYCSSAQIASVVLRLPNLRSRLRCDWPRTLARCQRSVSYTHLR